jgi:hypothetical protein
MTPDLWDTLYNAEIFPKEIGFGNVNWFQYGRGGGGEKFKKFCLKKFFENINLDTNV